jgi:hypothetical protein
VDKERAALDGTPTDWSTSEYFGSERHKTRSRPTKIHSINRIEKLVSVMAGMRMSHAEIAGVIINPRTEKPIDDMPLRRAFAAELAVAKAKIKSLVSTRFYEALLRGEQWAINFGLRHFLSLATAMRT